jgi:dienelactone hydrolase
VIDVQERMSAIAHVNRPAGPDDEQRPAILCWHGHTGHGKEPIMGNVSSSALASYVAENNADYGRQMAQEGFVTFAIDWMGQGDRDDSAKPNHHDVIGDRDWCNLYYLHATMLGHTPLGMNVAHGRALLDFAAGLPFVDADRIGVMGESGGGTLSLWTALCDSRIRAIEIICYSDLFADFGYRDANYCGTQVTPGLYSLVDVPDLQGLLAPRPLLVDIGVYDECFRLESAMACHRRVAEIYDAAGAGDLLELDLFAGGHAWSKAKSVSFFERHLAPAT